MIESIVGGIAVLVIAWLANQPRPKALLRRLTSRAEPLLGAGEEPSVAPSNEWSRGVREFRDAASIVWSECVKGFERVGFYGESSHRDGLRTVVSAAPWPDVEVEGIDAAVLAQGALTDFCARVYSGSGEGVFEDTDAFLRLDSSRRSTTGAFKDWFGRCGDADYVEWLREELQWSGLDDGPSFHESTMKLVWYLELALAAEVGSDSSRLGFFAKVRDALNS